MSIDAGILYTSTQLHAISKDGGGNNSNINIISYKTYRFQRPIYKYIIPIAHYI